ncbi:hypothetical protein [Geminisphaera colitermitum]|uniref:hypothetical protein n=1 Tax=Geminisphaera colitermitum TaxID=1148786 RepID=UPI000158CA7F|nr:hypothetical protein [Geminisphaera colitermitum]
MPDLIYETILDLPEKETAAPGDYVEMNGPDGPCRIAAQALGGGFAPVLVSTPIAAGASAVIVEFPVPFAAPPSRIFCSITKPENGDNLWANPVAESITMYGFTVELSGPPSIAGHILVCLILP